MAVTFPQFFPTKSPSRTGQPRLSGSSSIAIGEEVPVTVRDSRSWSSDQRCSGVGLRPSTRRGVVSLFPNTFWNGSRLPMGEYTYMAVGATGAASSSAALGAAGGGAGRRGGGGALVHAAQAIAAAATTRDQIISRPPASAPAQAPAP